MTVETESSATQDATKGAVPAPGRRRGRAGRWLGWLLALGVAAGAIGLWEGAVAVFNLPHWKLPAPSAVAAELVHSRGLLLRHTWVTGQEVLIGFGAALAIGVLMAVLIAYSRTFQRVVYPLVISSQAIPIIVIAPLLLIWVGYGLAPKIIIVVLIAFFPIVVNTVDGLKAVDADMISLMRTLGASRWQVFRKVQVPTSLPYLFSGLKIAVTVSVIGAVIGEWVGANAGLGYLTKISVPLFQTARSFAAIVILGAMGVGLFLGVALLERLMLPWYHTTRRRQALEQE